MCPLGREQSLQEKIRRLERRIVELESLRENTLNHARIDDAEVSPRGPRANPSLQPQSILEKLVAATGSVSGELFFLTLAQKLSQTLGTRYALISGLSQDGKTLRTFGMWANGAPAGPIEYRLIGTPCEIVLREGEFFWGSDLVAKFPLDEVLVEMGAESYFGVRFCGRDGQPLGRICVLDDRPLEDRPEIRSVLRLFANRAALELERMVTSGKLRQSEHFIERVTRASPDLIYVFSLDQESLQYANRSPLADLGYSEEVQANTQRIQEFQKYLSPDDEQGHLGRVLQEWRTLTDGEVRRDEYRVLHANGSLRVFSGREVVFSRHADGSVQEILGTLNEITELKKSEAALRESRERFRLALDVARLGPFDWDLCTDKVVYSQEYKRQLGYLEHEYRNELVEWTDRLHPDDKDRVLKIVASCQENHEREFEVEYRLRHKDGRYRWILSRGVFIHDESGTPIHMLGCHLNITERKRAVELLHAHSGILDQLSSGCSLEKVLEGVVRGIERLFTGMRASILLLEGNRLRHGAAPSLPREYTEHIDGLVIGPGIGSCGTAAFHNCRVIVEDTLIDPKWAPYVSVVRKWNLRACWSQPIRDECGAVLGTFALYYTEPHAPLPDEIKLIEEFSNLAKMAIERKATQDRLRRREMELAHIGRLGMLGETIAEIAHEISQPLYSIKNFSQACLNEIDKPGLGNRDDLREWLERIRRASTRSTEVFRRIAKFTRGGEQTVANCPLADIISDTLQLVSWRLSRQRIRVDVLHADLDAVVCVDAIQIEQVLSNLILNACDAIQHSLGDMGGHIVVNTMTTDSVVEVVVTDNGPGISDSVRESIFDPFVTTKTEGMGMGLAISRSIVESHGGKIWVTQHSPSGSEFHFTLPLSFTSG